MTCPPGCNGLHGSSTHYSQRRRTGKTWPVGSRAVESPLVPLSLRVSAGCRAAVDAAGSAAARDVLEEWAKRRAVGGGE